MEKKELLSSFTVYTNIADVNLKDFLEARKALIENIDILRTKIIYTEKEPVLEMIKIIFPLAEENEIASIILMEVLISLFLYTHYVEEGDGKDFRNNIGDIYATIDDEIKNNKKYPDSIQIINNNLDDIVKDIDMDMIDSFYNYMLGVLESYNISNNDDLISYMGISRIKNKVGFIIS